MPALSIQEYFPELSLRQKEQFAALAPLYAAWNNRINVISRKDMPNFYTRHVLHSLAVGHFCGFGAGARVLDVGCGGGFPGIPLAILYPWAHFTLCDSIGKKIKVVEQVAKELELKNVTPVNARVEGLAGPFDYVVSRAVAPAADLVAWTWDKIAPGQVGTHANGMLLLKGGELADELAVLRKTYELFPVSGWLDDEFFTTKSVVYIKK